MRKTVKLNNVPVYEVVVQDNAVRQYTPYDGKWYWRDTPLRGSPSLWYRSACGVSSEFEGSYITTTVGRADFAGYLNIELNL